MLQQCFDICCSIVIIDCSGGFIVLFMYNGGGFSVGNGGCFGVFVIDSILQVGVEVYWWFFGYQGGCLVELFVCMFQILQDQLGGVIGMQIV